MRPTRRCWTVIAVGLVFTVAAVLYQRPSLLVGTITIGAWLLAQQYQFQLALQRADETLVIDRSLERQRAMTETPVSITLTARKSADTDLTISVSDAVPVGGRSADPVDERRIGLDDTTTANRTVYNVTAPLAGALTFSPPTVSLVHNSGLFETTWTRGPESTLDIEPRTPRNIHVGEGGQQVAMAYGEHEVEERGAGLDPAELRKYVAGDTASRIDWKATARLNEPYVREYEVETDRKTALVMDHRAVMGTGQCGQTQLDYLREIALVILEAAEDANDPLGLYAVGDDGVTERTPPSTAARQYTYLARSLRGLSPTVGSETVATNRRARSPADSRRAAALLRDSDAAFARTLAAYYDDAGVYIDRIAEDPLFETVRSVRTRLQGSLLSIICTDDSNRAELREAVKLARRGENRVLVLLTPRSLFTPGGLADLEDAYAEYLEFEEFRRDLTRLNRVSALEVVPGDRLAAVLHNRRARQPRNV